MPGKYGILLLVLALTSPAAFAAPVDDVRPIGQVFGDEVKVDGVAADGASLLGASYIRAEGASAVIRAPGGRELTLAPHSSVSLEPTESGGTMVIVRSGRVSMLDGKGRERTAGQNSRFLLPAGLTSAHGEALRRSNAGAVERDSDRE